MKRNPQTRPIMGEMTIKAATTVIVSILMAARPAADMPAPAMPPISACDDEVGRPKNQVIRFHEIAPIRALRMIYGTMFVLTTSR